MWLSLLLSCLLLHLCPSSAQFIQGLPACLQDCVNNYDSICAPQDLSCLCQLSRGGFLTQVAQCFEISCNDTTDINEFLTTLEAGCQQAGVSIPLAVLSSAAAVGMITSPSSQSVVSSSVNGVSSTAMASTTAQTAPSSISQPTSTSTGSTSTRALSATFADTTLVPSSSASQPGASLVGASTSTSSTAAAASPTEGNGSLFSSQNSAPTEKASSLLGLTVGVIAGLVWF